MGDLGATHWNIIPRLRVYLQQLESEVGPFNWNTYVDHPWPNWDRFSADLWGPGGRGDPIGRDLGHELVRHIFENRDALRLRHYIYRRTLWTSFGGFSTWNSLDHSRNLRHVHMTLWK